jgi:hypothetical protein
VAAGTVKEKDPLEDVVVPCVEPFAVTETPVTGAPFSSKIVPVIVLVWENAICVNSTQTRGNRYLLRRSR